MRGEKKTDDVTVCSACVSPRIVAREGIKQAMMKRSFPSGYEKRKKKEHDSEVREQQSGNFLSGWESGRDWSVFDLHYRAVSPPVSPPVSVSLCWLLL